jgi:galactokinase
MVLAMAAQRAENEYVGIATGLMDQFAVTFGVEGAAQLLDCRTYEHRPVRIPGNAAIVVCDSKVSRRLVSSGYEDRRRDCERAAGSLAEAGLDVTALRDVTPGMLEANARLMDDVALRRARHVVSENIRVRDTVAALEADDLEAVGRLFVESHRSLRDDFEVSTAELDFLVETAIGVPGVYGARMTGAGFGGCTVNVVDPDAIDALRSAIADTYRARTGLDATTMRVWPSKGVGPLDDANLPAADLPPAVAAGPASAASKGGR